MIDEQTITREAYKYGNGWTNIIARSSSVDGFQNGARWAQKEVINSLWHDAAEEPDASLDAWIVMQTGKDFIEVHKYGGFNADGGQTWQQQAEKGFVIRWAYLSDLMPKGGEQ